MPKMNMPLPASQVTALERRLTELSGQTTSTHLDRLLKSAIVHVQGLTVQPDDETLAAELKRSLEELEAGGLNFIEFQPFVSGYGAEKADCSITKEDGYSLNNGERILPPKNLGIVHSAISKQDGYCLKCGVFGCTNPDHKD